MKIGIVCYPTLGGSGVLATELGHELANKGHQVHFITFEQPFRLRLENENLFFHEVDMNQYDLIRYPDYALSLAVKIAAISKEYDLDIMHVHYAIPHATSAYLARQLLGKKRPAIVTTLHGTDITAVGRDPAYFEIVKFSIEHSDGVTAVSNYLRCKTQEYFHIEKPIEVIYNFFIPREDVRFDKKFRQSLTPNGEKLIVHASNFRPVKRVVDVVKVFAKVQKQMPCKLLFIGTGVGVEDARNALVDLGLEDHVTFLGKQSNIDGCIASSDLFLLPSSQESFGLVALEAMAYGVPVIASQVGGLPEVVQDGKTGFLVPMGDVDAMAEKAMQILSQPELAKSMGEQGKTRAREAFTVDRILPQYEAFYERVLNQQ
ncbi:MAG: N-acetyl-alpha-D-glucosaminyl L-malate synthase BshA [Chlamydiales bacterium]|nr:N-acetyl-alpha-D-glucosaminyl L-malate synthase BshA [Chlamydiales bacterium]